MLLALHDLIITANGYDATMLLPLPHPIKPPPKPPSPLRRGALGLGLPPQVSCGGEDVEVDEAGGAGGPELGDGVGTLT